MTYFSKHTSADTQMPDALLCLMPPVFESNGEEIPFAAADGKYTAEGFSAEDKVEALGDGLFRVRRSVKNTGVGARTGKWIVEACDTFAADRYLIPCVSFSGNVRSMGKEPHGLCDGGKPWIFAYDRESIPSCTLTETADAVCALFASDADADSLVSSCALVRGADGRLAHRIYYPVTEAPRSYTDHDVLTARYDTYITLGVDETFTVEFYIFVGTPKWKNYGTATLLDRIEDIFPFTREPAMDIRAAWDNSIKQSNILMTEVGGVKMFRNAMRNDPNSRGIYMPYEVYEAGWSGQAIKQARMELIESFRTGDTALRGDMIGSLEAWAASQFANGLFPTNYARHLNKKYIACDVCNYGWAVSEMAESYALLKSHGIERPALLDSAVRLGGFFVTHYDKKTGFGLKWNPDGTKAADGGSIGGFMIMGLLSLFKVTGNTAYLSCAERAMALYTARDVDDFCITAGAIDCACIDKETAYPFIKSALDLYDITGKPGYLVTAEKAAYYFQSWMYYYDAIYPADSEFARLGYYTHGGTSVSTQHPAIDPWGVIVIPEYMRLAKATGDKRWLTRARALWCNALLCITPKGGITLHGHDRPEGLQSEAFFIARWTRYRRNREERGHLNDMFVGWPAAFRLTTLYRIQTELGGDFSVLEK